MSEPPISSASETQLNYATVLPPTGPRVWAAFAIMLGGLALIAIGGCFLVGVMLSLTNGFNNPSPGSFATASTHPALTVFVGVLYLLAFGSFGGGVWVLGLGIRGLWRVVA